MRALLLLLGLSMACADIAGFDGNPQMNPGQPCLGCHQAGGAAAGLAFTVAGTVFTQALSSDGGGFYGATITVTGADGAERTLRSNGAGNFYSADPIAFPIAVSMRVGDIVFPMQQPPPNGDCNSCHAAQSSLVAPIDAGILGFSVPGQLYAFASDGGCAAPQGHCPSPAPSFSTQIFPIVAGACFPCHADADQCALAYPDGGSCGISPTLDSYAVIAAADFTTTLGCVMPPSAAAPLSPDSFQLLADWLACGRPNN